MEDIHEINADFFGLVLKILRINPLKTEVLLSNI
jgi:hypothetical protein